MKTPYEHLGVAEQASDAEIKQAYLQKVRENPPDRDQERFQAIQTAYEAIKDAKSRLAYALFYLPAADFDGLLASAFSSGMAVRPLAASDFMALLSAGLDGAALSRVMPYKPS